MCIVDERYRATRVMNETGADRTQQLPAERPRPSTSDNNHLCVPGRVDESANSAVKEQLGVYVGVSASPTPSKRICARRQ
jgi:hypothetical protein